jgi:uncharacterized Rmd1/YagE family protein
MTEKLDTVRLRALQTRQERLSDEIELHCEQLDDDDKRLTRLEWTVMVLAVGQVVIAALSLWAFVQ